MLPGHILSQIPGMNQNNPTPIYQDNRGCVLMCQNESPYKFAKHIDIKFHFVRQHINAKAIKAISLGTDKMLADMNTKALRGVGICKASGNVDSS